VNRIGTRGAIGLVAAVGLAGCLNQLIPKHGASSDTAPGNEVAGLPIYDMAHSYTPDPKNDAGMPVKFADIQAGLDAMGCTTAMCHGGTQVPVLAAKPNAQQMLLNYFDLLSGCANGAPDPSDCIYPTNVAESILLAKTCATSGVMHAGGAAFKDDTDPTYQLWKAWIASGAPY
jgi:hypothetical protein